MIVDTDLSSYDAKTKVIPALDVAKFICSICIIGLHTHLFEDISLYIDYFAVQYIFRIIVPFFFVMSGYFCFRKTEYDNFDITVPMKYALRMFKLYCKWTLIYLLPFFVREIYNNGVVNGIFSAIRNFLFSGYHHLWYLYALAVAIVIIAVTISKKVRIETIIVMGVILYAVGLLGQSYFFIIKPLQSNPFIWGMLKLYKNIFVTTRNGCFEGVIFVGIGMLFAYKRIVFKYYWAILGFCTSMVLLYFEVFTIKNYYLYYERDMYIFLVPVTFFLFYLVSHIDIKKTMLTERMRKYSMLIYYVHSWILFPIMNVSEVLCRKISGVGTFYIPKHFIFLLVVTGTLIVSYIIINFSEKRLPLGKNG